MVKKNVCWILVSIMVLASSAVWAGHHEGEFEAMVAKWEGAYNEGDVAAVAAMYAEDGMRMPPDTPMVKGREAIAAQIQAGIDGGLVKVKIDVGKMEVHGTNGHGWGTFMGMDAEGNTITKGKWANHATYVDGKWQVQYDIFNYDAPTPPME
jgi:uncharacterized protein (TIGR02246 family)